MIFDLYFLVERLLSILEIFITNDGEKKLVVLFVVETIDCLTRAHGK